MYFNIGLISPYNKLNELAIKIAHKKNISLTVRTAVLEDVLSIADNMISNDIDVIIVRENTDAYLTKKVNVPVIPIPVSNMDILKAIIKAKNISSKFILANFRNKYRDISIFEEAINCKIEQFVFYNEEEARRYIKQIINDYDVVIGGGLTTRIAKDCDINSVLIESGVDTIEYTLDIAHNMAISRWREQQKIKEFSIIINQSKEGLIAVDNNNNITVFNPKAEEIIETYSYQIDENKKNHILDITRINKTLKDLKPINKEIVKINEKNIIINTVPTIVNQKIAGCVCTLQEVSSVQNMEHHIRMSMHTKGLIAKSTFDDIIGESYSIQDTIIKAKKYAKTDFTVLITGKTGTGKELFAQSLHNYSIRKNGPFVAINCAAIPNNLLEAELFGYEEGSFTGAKKGGKIGLFELAHKGTLFLDEIGKLDLGVQSRLLRVIQEREIIRVGGNKIIPIDVRIIAATNIDLYTEVQKLNFLEDLYYRLNVLNLNIPVLNERPDDIPLLAKHILRKYNVKEDEVQIIIHALSQLKNYEWKGNVRELENILARLIVSLQNKNITYKNVFYEMQLYTKNVSKRSTKTKYNNQNTLDFTKIHSEKDLIGKLLQQNLTHKQISEKLGISRTTLWRRLKDYQLNFHI